MRRVKKACVSSSAIPSWWSTQPSRVRLRLKVRSPMAGESNATRLRRRGHPAAVRRPRVAVLARRIEEDRAHDAWRIGYRDLAAYIREQTQEGREMVNLRLKIMRGVVFTVGEKELVEDKLWPEIKAWGRNWKLHQAFEQHGLGLKVLRGETLKAGDKEFVPNIGDRAEAAEWLTERGFGRAPLNTEESSADETLADLMRTALGG